MRSGRARVVTRKGRVRRRWMRGGSIVMTRPSFNEQDVSARENIATTLYNNLDNFKKKFKIVSFANSNIDKRVIVYGTLQKIGEGFFQDMGVDSKRYLQIYGVPDVTVAATEAAAAAAAAAGVPRTPDPEELSTNDDGAGEEGMDIPDSLNAADAKVFVLVYSRNKDMTKPKVIFLDDIETVDIITDTGVSLANVPDGTPYGRKRPILVLTYKERFKNRSPTGNKVIKFTGNSSDQYVRKWRDEGGPNFRLYDNSSGPDVGWWVNSTEPNNTFVLEGYFDKESRRNGNRFIDEWFKALRLHVLPPSPP